MSESNQVKWVGVRPINPLENIQVHLGPFETSVCGTTRTQILKHGSATADTVILHTVTTGKTLYITSCCISLYSAARGVSSILIRDTDDTTVAEILCCETNAAGENTNSQSFIMPIKVLAGYDVVATTDAGTVHGTIQGWEE